MSERKTKIKVKLPIKWKEIHTKAQARLALIRKPKPLPLKTVRIITISVSCTVAIALVVALCMIFLLPPSVNYKLAFANVHNFKALDVTPEATNEKVALPYDTVEENVYFLYDNANRLCKEADALTVYNKGSVFIVVGKSENIVSLDTVLLKTQDRYFYCDHHLEYDVPLADSPLIGSLFLSRGAIISTRVYDEIGGAAALQQQILSANGFDENELPYADWDNAKTAKVEKPTYNAIQNNDFSLVTHNIKADRIKNCTLEEYKDKDTGEEYYKISFDLDVDNPETTKVSRQEIIDGTGDKNCNYESISFEATIWRNGAFRTLTVTEHWMANFYITKGNFTMTKNWHFSYIEEDCDIDKYPEAKTLIELYRQQ